MATNEEQIKKTLVLGVLAIAAFGVMILAYQFVQQRQFWKEIDEWRESSKYGEFLRWLRENPGSEFEAGGSE